MTGLPKQGLSGSPSTDRYDLCAAILQSASEPIIAIGPQGRVFSWNASAERMFAVEARDAIGRRFGTFLAAGTELDVDQAIGLVFAGERAVRLEATYVADQSGPTPVSILFSPVHGEDGAVVAVSAIIHERNARPSAPRSLDELPLFAHLLADNQADQPIAPRRNNILVVEDEPLIGMGLAAMLEMAGFDVIGPACTVTAAMKLLDAHDCALAILDVNLGRGETSEPLARRLQEAGIPFFITSGQLPSAREAAFREAPRFMKPFGAQKLVAAVHQVLG